MFSDSLDGNIYVMLDGDDTYDTSKIKETINLMINENYDMLVAKRIHSDPLAYRRGHVIGNKFFSKVCKFNFWRLHY